MQIEDLRTLVLKGMEEVYWGGEEIMGSLGTAIKMGPKDAADIMMTYSPIVFICGANGCLQLHFIIRSLSGDGTEAARRPLYLTNYFKKVGNGAQLAIQQCWEDLRDSSQGLMSKELMAQALCEWGEEEDLDSEACNIYCKIVKR